MSISQFLKRIGKTKTELAEELALSRPTLNQYIELFETGQKIENERYDIIFKRLFSDQQADKDLFERRLYAIKNLLERDKKYDIGFLEPEAADIVARIHNNMVQDMSREGWDKKVYDTILILLSQYNDYPIMHELAGYFSDLNSDSDISNLSIESKAYYSYYYNCFRKIAEKPPKYDAKTYEEFLARKEQLTKEKEELEQKRAKSVKSRLNIAVQEILQEFQKNGIEATEDEILREVIRRMNGMGAGG